MYIPPGYTITTDSLSGNGAQFINQRIKDIGLNVDYEVSVKVAVGGFVTIGHITYSNTTEAVQIYTVTGTLDSDKTDLEIIIGNNTSEPIDGTVLIFNSVTAGRVVFRETFHSITSYNIGMYGVYVFDSLDGNLWMALTCANSSRYSTAQKAEGTFVNLYDEETAFEVTPSSGLTFKSYYHRYPVACLILFNDFEETNIEIPHTNAILDLTSVLAGKNMDEMGFSGCYGLWIRGTEEKGYPCLWVSLSHGTELYDSSYPYPEEDWYGQSDYTYTSLGPGEKTLDLSGFSDLLGGITGIEITAYIKTYMN